MGRNEDDPKHYHGQCGHHHHQKDLKPKDKEHQERYNPNKPSKFPSSHEKYKTSSSEPDISQKKGWQRDANYTISNVKKEQYDYIRNSLYIKSALDRDKTILKFQLKKLSIRNYTPKTINQEYNMGMWI